MSLNITNPRKRPSPAPKGRLIRWSVAYTLGGLAMVLAAYLAVTVLPLGR